MGVPHYELDHTIHNLLIQPRVSVDDVLMNTRVKHMDLVPSNIDLSAAEIQLVNEVGREQTLARSLHPILDRYDYVLIDCQPLLGLLTVNGLAVSDGVIIPTECEYFSLRGLALLSDTVEKVRDRLPEAGDQRHLDHPLRPENRKLPRGYGPCSGALRRTLESIPPSSPVLSASRRPASPVNRSPRGHQHRGRGAAAILPLAREVIDRFGA